MTEAIPGYDQWRTTPPEPRVEVTCESCGRVLAGNGPDEERHGTVYVGYLPTGFANGLEPHDYCDLECYLDNIQERADELAEVFGGKEVRVHIVDGEVDYREIKGEA